MNSLFYNCSSLTFIDLSKFNTSKITTMKYMFYGCSSLKYLNLFKFQINKEVIIDNAFHGIPLDSKYCITDEETIKYLLGNDRISDCFYIYFPKKRKVDYDINRNCVLEYSGSCVSSYPEGTYGVRVTIKDNRTSRTFIDCREKPQGSYFNVFSGTLKPCFENCKSCYGFGYEEMNNCKECKDDFEFLNDLQKN